jgi:hypothetical protein
MGDVIPLARERRRRNASAQRESEEWARIVRQAESGWPKGRALEAAKQAIALGFLPDMLTATTVIRTRKGRRRVALAFGWGADAALVTAKGLRRPC